jgi:tRNA A-37 threonylcarbamoyl transferase component Bud32
MRVALRRHFNDLSVNQLDATIVKKTYVGQPVVVLARPPKRLRSNIDAGKNAMQGKLRNQRQILAAKTTPLL